MSRIAFTILILTLLLLPNAAADAQDDWRLFVLDADARQLLQIDLEGNVAAIDLPLDENTYVGPSDIVISDDGQRLAYSSFTYNTDGSAAQELVVIDLVSGETLLTRDYSDRNDVQVSKFHAAGNEIAVGVVNYLFDGQPDTNTDGPAWELDVIEISTNTIVANLAADDATVLELPREFTDVAFMPVVLRFDDAQIDFTQVPWLGAGFDDTFGVSWNLAENTVTDAPQFAASALATLGHEVAVVALDDEAPASDPFLPVLPFNTVELVEADTSSLIFQSGGPTIAVVRFIDDGQRLAIQTLDAQDEVTQLSQWLALGRDGMIEALTLPEANVFSELRAAPNGYVILTTTYSDDFSEPPTVTLKYGSEGVVTELWSGESNYYSLVWTAPVMVAENLPPFTPLE